MAVIRRNKTNKDALLKRAHLGNITQAEEVLDLAKQNGIQTAPVDIEALMSLLGIQVIREDLDSETSGYLKKENGSWKCGVNRKHHPTRQRFTLAHELGHYLLHRNDHSKFEDTILFRNGDQNTMEYEANYFAGSILMPEKEFLLALKKYSSDIDDMASHFGVSPLAIRVRAGQLGFKEGAL